jgi:hypothetical protein
MNWSQIATSSQRHRRTSFAPYAFSEHGAIMAANVLNTDQAIKMSVYVVRAFIQLREFLSSNKELALRLDQLEARLEKKLDTHDEAIAAMLSAIRELMLPPTTERPGIGFTADIRMENEAELPAACRAVTNSIRAQPAIPCDLNGLRG